MLTLPDFRQKQILFIKTDNLTLNKIKIHNDNIIFKKGDKVENRVSCYRVISVFIIGRISITSELIKKCLKYGISLFLLKDNLECYAYINSIAHGNYLLREKQYLLTKEDELFIAKRIVLNKIENQISLMKSRKIMINKKLLSFKNSILDSKNLDTLRGIEGNVSKEFFSLYFKDINWKARSVRTKIDIPNFLLDIGYNILFCFIDTLLNLFGFDTYKGCYHKLFFQRKSLSCDMIEPFRGIIDREVVKIFSLNILNENDFKLKNDRFFLNYSKTQKYTLPFMEAVMKNKEDIYSYIKGFYNFMMDKNKYEFPYFKISRQSSMILVAYDFCDDKLRNDFSKFLRRFGRKIQYSIYEIRNSPRILRNIILELELKYKKRFKKSDSVLVISICQSCIDKIRRYGYSENEETDIVWFE